MATATIDIEYSIQFYPMTLTGDRGKIKSVSKITPHVKDLLDARIFIRADETGGFNEVGAVKDAFENEFEIGPDKCDITGHVFELRVGGVTKAGGEVIGLDMQFEPTLTNKQDG